MSTVLARFAGRTQCRSLPQAPLALLIQGVLENHGSERAQLAFVQPVVDGLPGELPGALIERLDDTRYRLSSAGRAWEFTAARAYLHRDVGAAVFAAVPPRTAPLAKRMFWRLVLWVAGSALGRSWLAARRRRLQ